MVLLLEYLCSYPMIFDWSYFLQIYFCETYRSINYETYTKLIIYVRSLLAMITWLGLGDGSYAEF